MTDRSAGARKPRQGGDKSQDTGKFIWGGCGDNLEMGYKLGRDFLGDVGLGGRLDVRKAMILHNHEAGRKVRNKP